MEMGSDLAPKILQIFSRYRPTELEVQNSRQAALSRQLFRGDLLGTRA